MLIIHPGTLGDVIVSLPAIRMLRRAFPRHEIILAAQAQIGRLFQMCGEIDSVWSMEGMVLSELFQENPVFHDSIHETLSRTTHVVGWLHDTDHCLANNFRNLGIQRITLISPKDQKLQSCHMSDRYVDTIKPWVATRGIRCRLFSPLTVNRARHVHLQDDDVAHAEDEKIVFIHPGSGSPHKCLPSETLASVAGEIASNFHARVLLCEGPDDRGQVERLLSNLGHQSFEILREKNLIEMSHFLSRADLFLGHDSGLTHLAAALGVPTVVIFGPTDPEQWRPSGEHVTVVQGQTCLCRTWSQVQVCENKVCLISTADDVIHVIKKQLAHVDFRRGQSRFRRFTQDVHKPLGRYGRVAGDRFDVQPQGR